VAEKKKSTKKRLLVGAGVAALVVAAAAGIIGANKAGAATTPQYANGVANGAAATASYVNGTWTLDSGHGTGGSAQVDLVKPGTATTAPTMTTSNESAGDPRWVIEFHNGCYLFGIPANGANSSTLAWTLNPSGTAETSYANALTAAQACGADDQVTAAFIVQDTGNPDTTVNLTNVTYDGNAVVPEPAYTILYDGHGATINPTSENVTFMLKGVPSEVMFVIHGPGKIDNHVGWVSAKDGANVGVYKGLEANHGYTSCYTPVTGGAGSTTPGPGHGGCIYFVSNSAS
jgi:hypothetical protein